MPQQIIMDLSISENAKERNAYDRCVVKALTVKIIHNNNQSD